MDAGNVYATFHDRQTVGVLRRVQPLHCHLPLRPSVNRSQLVLGRVLFLFHFQPTMRLNPLTRHKFGTEKPAALLLVVVREMDWRALTMWSGGSRG